MRVSVLHNTLSNFITQFITVKYTTSLVSTVLYPHYDKTGDVYSAFDEGTPCHEQFHGTLSKEVFGKYSPQLAKHKYNQTNSTIYHYETKMTFFIDFC